MPETNLPPLQIHVREDLPNRDNLVDAILLRRQLPELPEQIRQRLKDVLKISPDITIALMVKLNTECIQTKNRNIFNILYYFRATWSYYNYFIEL